MQGKNNSLCKQYFIFGTCGCQTHTGVKTDVECLGPAAIYRALLFYVVAHWYNLHQLFFRTLNWKVQQLLMLYLCHCNYLGCAFDKHSHISWCSASSWTLKAQLHGLMMRRCKKQLAWERSALKIWYKLLLKKVQVPFLQPVTCSHTVCWSLVVLSISALLALGTLQKICAKVTWEMEGTKLEWFLFSFSLEKPVWMLKIWINVEAFTLKLGGSCCGVWTLVEYAPESKP